MAAKHGLGRGLDALIKDGTTPPEPAERGGLRVPVASISRNSLQPRRVFDEAYAAQIHYWTTPQTKCVDGSGDNCTSYDEWVNKWQEIKG